jgi:hypothetical protein
MVVLCQYLDELDRARKEAPGRVPSPREVLLRFRPDSLKGLAKTGGSQCVGLVLRLVDELRELGIPALVGPGEVPSFIRRPWDPAFGHAFGLIAFADGRDRGFVVLDPGVHLPGPVVVREGRPGVLEQGAGADRIRWEFIYEPAREVIRCFRTARGKRLDWGTLHAMQWLNPDPVLTRSGPVRHGFSVVQRDELGAVAAVAIDLESRSFNRVVRGQEKLNLSLDERAAVDDALTAELARALRVSRRGLAERLFQILDHEDELASIRVVPDAQETPFEEGISPFSV